MLPKWLYQTAWLSPRWGEVGGRAEYEEDSTFPQPPP